MRYACTEAHCINARRISPWKTDCLLPTAENNQASNGRSDLAHFFMVLITIGLWLFVIPLYPARCINCGMTRGSAFWQNLTSRPRMAVTTSSVLVILVILFLVFRAGTSESASMYHSDSATPRESPPAVPENPTGINAIQQPSRLTELRGRLATAGIRFMVDSERF